MRGDDGQYDRWLLRIALSDRSTERRLRAAALLEAKEAPAKVVKALESERDEFRRRLERVVSSDPNPEMRARARAVLERLGA